MGSTRTFLVRKMCFTRTFSVRRLGLVMDRTAMKQLEALEDVSK